MTPDELLAAVAMQYDGDDHEGDRLLDAARRRLAFRTRHGGKGCSACHEILPLSAFGPDGSRPDGLAHRCRPCRALRERALRRIRKHEARRT
ncbi:HNH endonuclease [Arthrobacter phage BaileyBlu]|uniref:HNH endonuclease n=1 Tax=Arthrobacter phage BaileyBlu TaxID=2910754 RepID=A0AA49BPH7_9CAUD|nr:endonuclease VII [Arthrobacter phage BaileyBlu]UJQ87197.1 HNH endonuclease [Arthrobacter phage BaileyBlu]